MRGVYTVEEMRAAEAGALAATLPGALMQRAATAVAVSAAGVLDAVYGARVTLLVGAGNNGGDALFAGAWLAARGARVTAILLDSTRVHPDGWKALRQAGGRAVGTAQRGDLLRSTDLVIDGILGLGGRGGLRDDAAQLVPEIPAPVIAVDLPSGIDADTGEVSGPAIAATITVTFGGLKPGLLIGAGAAHAGEVRLAELGFGPYFAPARLEVCEAVDVCAALPVPDLADDKYTRGVVGVVAGGPSYSGAAVLSTGGAVHGGAGMVRYAGGAPEVVRARWPEVVVHDDLASAGRVQAWLVGPGLGTDDQAARQLRDVLAADVPVLVDADGITLLADDPQLLARRTAPTVLTPHDREFARLFTEVGPDRVVAARRAAADSGAIVLLKGNTTVVADPSGHVYLNPTGTPWLGTAGSGDVLSGLIGALLASGLEPALGAAAGAYLHGVAGQLAAVAGPPSAVDVLAALGRARAAI